LDLRSIEQTFLFWTLSSKWDKRHSSVLILLYYCSYKLWDQFYLNVYCPSSYTFTSKEWL